jgi:hypothetical protein
MKLHPVTCAWLLGAVVACGDPEPSAIEYDEVAQIVGAMVATPDGGATVGAIADSLVLARGGMPEGFTYGGGMISGSHGALEHRYMMIQCRDRQDQLQPACTTETNLATVVASWSGTLHQPGVDIRSNRQGMWTLSNLAISMPSITGSSQLQSEATFPSGERYEVTADATEAMLAPSHTMAGTIQLALDVVRGPMQQQIAANLVFEGEAAALRLDGAHAYRIDLATGRVLR